jgi:hypothetical protein
MTWTPSKTEELFGPVGYIISADGATLLGTFATTTLTFPLVDPGLSYELSGNETLTVRAADLTFAQSRPSNGLVPRPR